MGRLAPSIRTPRFTRGDVLATMDPDTWINFDRRSSYNRAMWAAFAALAACARINPYRAVTLTVAQYDAGAMRVRSNRHSYPVLLIPVALAALERYLKLRRPLGGTFLFISENGNPLRSQSASAAFRRLAPQYGLHGGGILGGLFAFYDRCFVKESDRAAIIALRGGRAEIDRDVPRAEIVAAKDDLDRLWKVLKRRHQLAGEAGRWIGGHGKAKVAREMRLFKPIRSRTPITDFMRKDPVCALLLRQDWTGPKLTRQRAPLIGEHFAYLSDLRDRGLLKTRQIAYLLNLSSDQVHRLARTRRRAVETTEEREKRERLERDWDERILLLYSERVEGETPRAFFERVRKPEPGYPFGWSRLIRILKDAGVAPAQTRRAREETAGYNHAKSPKSEGCGGEKGAAQDANRRHESVQRGSKRYQNASKRAETPRMPVFEVDFEP